MLRNRDGDLELDLMRRPKTARARGQSPGSAQNQAPRSRNPIKDEAADQGKVLGEVGILRRAGIVREIPELMPEARGKQDKDGSAAKREASDTSR
jgi:hypothetical protein